MGGRRTEDAGHAWSDTQTAQDHTHREDTLPAGLEQAPPLRVEFELGGHALLPTGRPEEEGLRLGDRPLRATIVDVAGNPQVLCASRPHLGRIWAASRPHLCRCLCAPWRAG